MSGNNYFLFEEEIKNQFQISIMECINFFLTSFIKIESRYDELGKEK